MSQGSFDTLGTLKAVFVADVQSALKSIDSFSAKLQGVTEQAGSQLAKIGKSFEFLNTLIGAGIATKGFERFAELDKSMNELASSMGKTNAQFAATRTAIIQFANDSKVPVQVLTDSMRRFTAVGSTVPEAMRLATIAMQGAKAGMVDVGLSTNTLAVALKSFQIPASQAADVMGKLVAAGERSAGGFAEFSSALSQIGPLASGLGGNLDEVLGVLRLFTNETGNVTEGATKLRIVFQELLGGDKDSKQNQRLQEVLHSTVQASIENRGLVETLKLIITAAHGSSEALQEMVGSGRTLAAFTRLMKAGFDELDQSVSLFANSGAKSLAEGYADAKNKVSELLKETNKLVGNAVQLAFERNTEAIKGTLKAINGFITNNRELLSTLVQTGVYLSAGVVAIGAFKLAALATSKVVIGLGDAVAFTSKGIGLMASVLTGEAFAGFATLLPKITGFANTLKGLLFADFAGGAVKAALSLKVLTDAELAAAAAAGLARNAKGQFVSRIIEVGENVVTSATKVLSLKVAFSALAGQVAAGLAVFGTFLLIGREIGKALFDQSANLNATGDAWQKYHQSSALSRIGGAASGLEAINARLKAQSERVSELVDLYNQLAKAKNSAERDQIQGRIAKVQVDVEAGRGSTQEDEREIQGRIDLLQKRIADARVVVADNLDKKNNFAGSAERAAAIRAENEAVAKTRTAVDALTESYQKQGKSYDVARQLAEKDVAALDAAIKARSTARGVTEDQIKADHAAAAAQKDGAIAISHAGIAAEEAERSVKGLADALEAAGSGSELEHRLDHLDELSQKGRDGLKNIAKALTELDATIAETSPGTKRDELETKRNELAGQQRAILKSLEEIEKAKDKARADAAAKDQKAFDDQIKLIDGIRIETLRALGLEVEADRAAANAKLQERIRVAEELRKSTVKGAGALADAQIAEARRAHAAELAQIERAQREKEAGYATAQAARQKVEDDEKRAILLSEAAELTRQADAARARGDLRAEQVLREKIKDLIQQAGSRSADLLEKERDLRQTAKDRLELIKQEVDSRLRLGEGGAGIVEGTRRGLRDIAGAESAPEFRGAIREKLGQTQTEGGAKELFEIVKKLLEAEFSGLQQQAGAAQKAGDKEGLAKALQGQRDVAERYRILNEELKRTLVEIKRTGGKPADAVETPTLIPGSQVRPDEKVPGNVRVIGPATKDKAQIDAANAARASGQAEDLLRPIKIDPSSPIKLDDSQPIRVIVTNPNSTSGVDLGPLVGPPASLAVDREPESEPQARGGGLGPLGFVGAAIAATSLAAASTLQPDSVNESGANYPTDGLVGPPSKLAQPFDRVRAKEAFEARKAATIEKNKADREARSKNEAERAAAAKNRIGGGSGAPAAPGSPGASPTPGIGVPDSSGLVQQTFDAVAGAAKGLQTTATQLLDAIKSSGDATVSALGAVKDKLGDAVTQLNTVTAKVQGIEAETMQIRIEGRD